MDGCNGKRDDGSEALQGILDAGSGDHDPQAAAGPSLLQDRFAAPDVPVRRLRLEMLDHANVARRLDMLGNARHLRRRDLVLPATRSSRERAEQDDEDPRECPTDFDSVGEAHVDTTRGTAGALRRN